MQGEVFVGGLMFMIGLFASIASSYGFKDKAQMEKIASRTVTSFQPRGWKGERTTTNAPTIFQIMWLTLYFLLGVAAMFLLVQSAAGELYHPEDVQTSGVLVGSALLLTAAYPPTIAASHLGNSDDNMWLFKLAYIQIGVAALLTVVGTVVGDTFTRGALLAICYGIPTGLLGGWLIVATVIGIVLERKISNNGGRDERHEIPEPGLAPLASAVLASVAAIVAKNPTIAVPPALVCFFLIPDRKHVYALIVSLIAWIGASCLVVF